MKNNTLSNLQVLKITQKEVKTKLGKNYVSAVTPYVKIIEMVMTANAINEFEALNKIKETMSIYKKEGAPLLFSAALVEITEQKHFVEFKEVLL